MCCLSVGWLERSSNLVPLAAFCTNGYGCFGTNPRTIWTVWDTDSVVFRCRRAPRCVCAIVPTESVVVLLASSMEDSSDCLRIPLFGGCVTTESVVVRMVGRIRPHDGQSVLAVVSTTGSAQRDPLFRGCLTTRSVGIAHVVSGLAIRVVLTPIFLPYGGAYIMGWSNACDICFLYRHCLYLIQWLIQYLSLYLIQWLIQSLYTCIKNDPAVIAILYRALLVRLCLTISNAFWFRYENAYGAR